MNCLLAATDSAETALPGGSPCLLPKRSPCGVPFGPGSRVSRAGLSLLVSQKRRACCQMILSFKPHQRAGTVTVSGTNNAPLFPLFRPTNCERRFPCRKPRASPARKLPLAGLASAPDRCIPGTKPQGGNHTSTSPFYETCAGATLRDPAEPRGAGPLARASRTTSSLRICGVFFDRSGTAFHSDTTK